MEVGDCVLDIAFSTWCFGNKLNMQGDVRGDMRGDKKESDQNYFEA